MTRTVTALADRLVGLVVPKAEAAAACNPDQCRETFCYCRGIQLYRRNCCKTVSCGEVCGPCRRIGPGC